MTYPTVVFVVMQVDVEGVPRGFHKALPNYWLEESHGKLQLAKARSENHIAFELQECVIMGRDEYDRLVGPATLPGDL